MRIRFWLMAWMIYTLYLSLAIPVHAQSLEKAKYQIEFVAREHDKIPQEIKHIIITTMQDWQEDAPPENTFYLVGYRLEDTWGIFSLTLADLRLHNLGQETELSYLNAISVLVVKTSEGWQAVLDVNTDQWRTLIELVPEGELSMGAREALLVDPNILRKPLDAPSHQGGAYKLPWPAGNPWRRTSGYGNPGWHDTTGYPPSHALDFDIQNAPNSDILASASGEVVWMCQGDKDNYFILVRTSGTNETFGYLHLDGATVRPLGIKIGSTLSQGQLLGQMWVTPTTGRSDACGSSFGTHIHLNFPYRPFTIDGYTFTPEYTYEGIDLYSTQGQTPDNIPPTIIFTQNPTPNRWYNTNQTIAWSISDAESGVRGFTPAWDVTPNGPPPTNNSSSGTEPLSSAGQGSHAFYVRAWDNSSNNNGNGNEAMASIGWFGYDTVAPIGSITINDSVPTTPMTFVRLNIPATDATSGVVEMRLRDNGGTWTSWMPYRTTLDWQLVGVSGQNATVDVQFRDRAGNISNIVSDSIQLSLYPSRPASANYRLSKSVFGAGGGSAASPQYRLNGTIGQSSGTGNMSSSNYRLQLGFWGSAAGNTPVPTVTPTVPTGSTATATATFPPSVTPTATSSFQEHLYLPMIRR